MTEGQVLKCMQFYSKLKYDLWNYDAKKHKESLQWWKILLCTDNLVSNQINWKLVWNCIWCFLHLTTRNRESIIWVPGHNLLDCSVKVPLQKSINLDCWVYTDALDNNVVWWKQGLAVFIRQAFEGISMLMSYSSSLLPKNGNLLHWDLFYVNHFISYPMSKSTLKVQYILFYT